MVDSQPEVDIAALVSETIEFITVRAADDGSGAFIGEAPGWFGDRLFGGFVVGQAVHAATQFAPDGLRIHSLHGYFLRPMMAGTPVRYEAAIVKDGRSFSTRRLDVTQNGATVFTMTCSFTADTAGYAYDTPLDDPVPSPDALERGMGPGPWEVAWIGPTDAREDRTRRSTHRAWSRVAQRLPDDPNLHAAMIGFLTDVTGTGGRPLHLDGDTFGMVSLDHAVWFHRVARADEWLLYDVHSLVNAGGRGLLRGVLRDGQGQVVASLAQEMLLTPVP
jgi:acyl-CoA thioesterase-2